MALDKKQIDNLYFKATGQTLREQDMRLVTAFALAIEDHMAKEPVIDAVYETTGPGHIAHTSAPIKRISRNDDDSFTVVIDARPVDAPSWRK